MLDLPENVKRVVRLRPGAKALIVKDGRFLVVQERVINGGEQVVIHDFPGGGIDPQESMQEAVKREVFEELGLTITPEKIIGGWDFVISDSDDLTDGVQIICIAFMCTLVGESEIDMTHNPAQEDIFNVRWMTPNEIRNEKIFHRQGIYDAITAAEEWMQSHS